MRMKPIIKNNFVYAKYIFENRFAGGPGLVHGGILSAALDDLMGYSTVIHNRNVCHSKSRSKLFNTSSS
jgi:hypothetical protein